MLCRRERCQPERQQGDKARVDRMQYVVRQMIAKGPVSPERVINGVGDERKRVPVGEIEGREGELEKECVKLGYIRVLIYIFRVVPVDEAGPERRDIYKKGHERGDYKDK